MRIVVGQTLDAHQYRCFLDGEELKGRCYAADDEEGVAWCYVLDAANHLKRDPSYPSELLTERLTGAIRLERQ